MFRLISIVVVTIWLTHESIRYYDAHKLVIAQRQRWEGALHQESPCAQSQRVRSIEYRGQVIECNALRLLMEQPVVTVAFSLWWKTSWWMHLHETLVQNTLILTILAIVIIVCTFMFGAQLLAHKNWQNQLIKMMPTPPALAQEAEQERPTRRIHIKEKPVYYLQEEQQPLPVLPTRKVVQNLRY
jgi:cell division protein FtsB